MKSYDIYHDFVICANIEMVYDAITMPQYLENWWPQKCSGKPTVGELYKFYFTDEYDWYGEVIKADTTRAFHIKMTQADEDWNPTSFGFDLEEIEQGTQVHFWHINWQNCNAHFKRTSYCWAILLSNLKKYLETGAIVPFEERE